MKAASYLSFDLGASGGKLCLGRFDGRSLGLEDVHRFESGPIAANDCLYWDVLGAYREMNAGIRRAASVAEGPIASIGLDSFSNDFGFVDRRGELLTPVRCYRDERTVRHAEAIYARMGPERLYAINGNQVAPFNTLMQLAAMREAGQGHILDNAHKLLFTPDLLAHFMTGEMVAEYTIASVSQMYDYGKGDWSDEILQAFDIPRGILCEIVEPGHLVGRTREAWNRELGVPGLAVVSVCEHDTASAFLAAPTEGPRAILSSGTWSLVGTEVPGPIIEKAGFACNIANEGGVPGRHRLLRNVMGLWIIQELKRQYGIRGESYGFAEMAEAASAAPPFAHRIDPDDPALFAPRDMIEAIAAQARGRGGPSPAAMGETVRCVYEGLAFKYRWAIEKLEGLCSRRLPSIDLVGGGSKNALLCQFTADACGRPVLAGLPDATALGNVLVQLLADGKIASMAEGKELIRSSFPFVEYLPRDRALWEDEYDKYKEHFALA